MSRPVVELAGEVEVCRLGLHEPTQEATLLSAIGGKLSSTGRAMCCRCGTKHGTPVVNSYTGTSDAERVEHRLPCSAEGCGEMTTWRAAAPNDPMQIYVASRASVAERPAMWQRLRAELGLHITATWIDEAGPGETADMGELWSRIVDEVLSSDVLVLYLEPTDLPLKGAYVEVGVAIGAGIPVRVCCPGLDGEERERRIGSWICHPAVTVWRSVQDAVTVRHGGKQHVWSPS